MKLWPSVDGSGGPATRAGADPARRAGRGARDLAVDALVFVLCLGFTALAFADDTQRQVAPVPAAVDAALGGLASLGVWLRRRWPVGFAVAAGGFAIFSVSASGVALVALFTVAVHRRQRIAVVVAAGLTLTSVLGLLVRPDVSPSWPGWLQGALNVVCVVAALAWGLWVRTRRQLALAERRRAASERELLVAQARQAERNRIAREVHDVLAHRLSLLSLHAGSVELWPDAPPEEIARVASVIRGSAHGALEDLRAVIGVLRADGGDDGDDGDERAGGEAPERPQPTLVELTRLIEESRQAGARVALACEVTDLGAVPEAVGRTAFRIVQEGLTNARKHADHADVSVAVRGAAADGLTVEVRNPYPRGAPSVPVPGAGMGIIGLAERTALSGGRLEHGPTPAGEFRLWAWLPWPA